MDVRVTFRVATGLLALMIVCPTWAQEQRLIDFSLKDQFNRVHTADDYKGVVVLVGSGRKGSQFNGTWSKAIWDGLDGHPYRDRVRIVGFADLRGVPFFIKGTVRKKFPKDKKAWVLLDWKGLFSKTYGYEPDNSNISVFGLDRRLVFQTWGRELEEAKVDSIVKAIRKQLPESENGY